MEADAQVQAFASICRSFHRYEESNECDIDYKQYSCSLTSNPTTFDWFARLLRISYAVLVGKETLRLLLILYVFKVKMVAPMLAPIITGSVFVLPLLYFRLDSFQDEIVFVKYRARYLHLCIDILIY